jgi:hypothetical protein
MLALVVIPFACKKEDANETAPLKISFRLMNEGQPLNTTDEYVNSSGERYTVRTFKFFVSNIRLRSASATSAEKESYHLVDLASAESKEINASFNKGSYNTIEFMLGVDSTRNVSGAQTGALDPATGMFWTWNTGYIFAKLEGNSPVSTAPSQAITYHIGGFRTGENAIRTISLPMPAGKPLVVGSTTQLLLDVDLAHWFMHQHTISIAATPSIMTPGGVSLKIADNYAGMFSVLNVITP